MECPNCGAHIGRFELDQNCKHCGVNLFYSQQEKLLTNDAKKCELEFASFRIFTAKLKAAFIRGVLPCLRIAAVVVCIGVLFVPFASLGVTLPMFSASLSFSGYGIYAAVSDGSLLSLPDFARIDVSSAVAVRAIIMLALFALVAICALLVLLAEFLSFLNIRKSAKAMCGLSAVGAVFSAAAVVFSFIFEASDFGFSDGAVSVSVGAGGFVEAAALILVFVINLLIIKKKIEPDIKQVDLDRVAMRKRIKAGEVTYDELPLPVFESEEERQARLLEEEKSEEQQTAVCVKGGADNG